MFCFFLVLFLTSGTPAQLLQLNQTYELKLSHFYAFNHDGFVIYRNKRYHSRTSLRVSLSISLYMCIVRIRCHRSPSLRVDREIVYHFGQLII